MNLQQKNLQLTPDLARELELAEAQAAVGCADRMIEMLSNSGSAVTRIAGGFAVYCGAGNPVTQAVGLGLQGPVSAEEFNQLEAFYFCRHEPVRVETCPLADPTLFEHYKERHYFVSEFSNVMVHPVLDGAATQSPTVPGIDIRLAGPDELDLWVMTVAQGFAENYPVTHEILSVMKMFAIVKNTQCYLAASMAASLGEPHSPSVEESLDFSAPALFPNFATAACKPPYFTPASEVRPKSAANWP